MVQRPASRDAVGDAQPHHDNELQQAWPSAHMSFGSKVCTPQEMQPHLWDDDDDVLRRRAQLVSSSSRQQQSSSSGNLKQVAAVAAAAVAAAAAAAMEASSSSSSRVRTPQVGPRAYTPSYMAQASCQSEGSQDLPGPLAAQVPIRAPHGTCTQVSLAEHCLNCLTSCMPCIPSSSWTEHTQCLFLEPSAAGASSKGASPVEAAALPLVHGHQLVQRVQAAHSTVLSAAGGVCSA